MAEPRLNYNHLEAFWAVAREGSLQKAGKMLGVTHSTLSTQVRSLEESLGMQLFDRAGRTLRLSKGGLQIFAAADEIFSLGRELANSASSVRGEMTRFNVGIVDALPKLIAQRLLAPVLELEPKVVLICREGPLEKHLADMSMHMIDVIISEAPAPPGSFARAYAHPLGETSISFFAKKGLLRGATFPSCLHRSAMLLPAEGSLLRRSLNVWFREREVSPVVVGEFDDSALMKVFGSRGVGVFPAPSSIEREICTQYGVRVVGRSDELKEKFFAISAERKVRHPAVLAIVAAAQG